MKPLFFAVFGLVIVLNMVKTAAFAEERTGELQHGDRGPVICVHPEDEKLKHMFSLGSDCRPVPGHGGVWNQERTTLTICANCQKEHEALSTQCQPTTVTCRKKRPSAD